METFSMGFRGLPLLSAPMVSQALCSVLYVNWRKAGPDPQILEFLDFPELGGENAQRTVAFLCPLAQQEHVPGGNDK